MDCGVASSGERGAQKLSLALRTKSYLAASAATASSSAWAGGGGCGGRQGVGLWVHDELLLAKGCCGASVPHWGQEASRSRIAGVTSGWPLSVVDRSRIGGDLGATWPVSIWAPKPFPVCMAVVVSVCGKGRSDRYYRSSRRMCLKWCILARAGLHSPSLSNRSWKLGRINSRV